MHTFEDGVEFIECVLEWENKNHDLNQIFDLNLFLLIACLYLITV